MATQIATLDAAKVERGVGWLKRLRSLPSVDKLPAQAEIERVAAALDTPASDAWIAARVVALLDPYFTTDTPQAVRMMQADDWAIALGGYPQWAIDRAARWWKSAGNPDRRKRPLEGDIAARCDIEVGEVRYGPQALARKRAQAEKDAAAAQIERLYPSIERRAQIMAEVGLDHTSLERLMKAMPLPQGAVTRERGKNNAPAAE